MTRKVIKEMQNSIEDVNKDIPVTAGQKREKSLKDMVIEKQTGKKIVRNKELVNTLDYKDPSCDKLEKALATKAETPINKNSQKETDKKASKFLKNLDETKAPDNDAKVIEKPDRKHRVKKDKKNKSNKSSVTVIVLCIISLLFATDVVSSAKITSLFRSIVDTVSGTVKSSDIVSANIPVKGVADSSSISKGRLSTTISDEQARLNQIAENSRVYCIISSSPYFDNANSKGSLYISNPTESVYHTQVVIKAKDTEKEMYVSPVLAPDEKVEKDYLTDRSFSNGEYQANAYFNYYTKSGDSEDPDDFTYIGTMCAEVLIVIDNK